MLDNKQFLEVIKSSFKIYLDVGTSRSTAKLKTLHGSIASDIKELLGDEYTIKSQGYGNNKEEKVLGRYYPKMVDITVCYKGQPIAGYAVKFVMRNYSQNSNNYFENMLGETANLRANSVPYFQIFIIFDKVPHYSGGKLASYDTISVNNLEKYLKLSDDNPNIYFHTPDITLLILLSLKEQKSNIVFYNENDYNNYYLSIINDKDLIKYSNKIKDTFGNSIVLNNYNNFIDRSCHTIKGKFKKY